MLKEQFELKGKVALITGSSQGIGKGIAKGLAEFGAEVIILYHSSKKEAEEVRKEIKDMGQKAHVFQADLSKTHSVAKIYTALAAKKLHPDILVINASVQVAKDWNNMTEKDFDYQVDTNFKSTLNIGLPNSWTGFRLI